MAQPWQHHCYEYLYNAGGLFCAFSQALELGHMARLLGCLLLGLLQLLAQGHHCLSSFSSFTSTWAFGQESTVSLCPILRLGRQRTQSGLQLSFLVDIPISKQRWQQEKLHIANVCLKNCAIAAAVQRNKPGAQATSNQV